MINREEVTGYGEGPRDEEPEPPPPETRDWEIRRPREHYSERNVFQVLLDGFPIGLLYLPNEEHAEWMRKRLTGE